MSTMEQTLIEQLIKEIRGEFGIPPFVSDEVITNYIKEGNHAFTTRYVISIDYESDLTARSLLKNYVNYAYFHISNEFFENYADDLVSWQLSKLGYVDENTSL